MRLVRMLLMLLVALALPGCAAPPPAPHEAALMPALTRSPTVALTFVPTAAATARPLSIPTQPPRTPTAQTASATPAPPGGWLDLAGYQMPPGLPLTIDGGEIFWEVRWGGRRYRASAGDPGTVAQGCQLSPGGDYALCKVGQGGREGIDALLGSLTDPAERAGVGAALDRAWAKQNPAFVVRRSPRQLVVLAREMDPRTRCWWHAAARVACHTSHGTGVWTSMLFDLPTLSYVRLPSDWNVDLDVGLRRGYLVLAGQLPGVLVYKFYSSDLRQLAEFPAQAMTTTEDTVLAVARCNGRHVCLRALRIGERGGLREHSWDIGSVGDRCGLSVALHGGEVVVEGCGQSLALSLDEVGRALVGGG